MTNNIVQQEILLVAESGIADHPGLKVDESSKNLSRMEQLELACWNGMLNRLVPGILLSPPEGKHFFLVQVQKARNSLYVDLCEQPVPPCREFSIDPFFFAQSLGRN